MTTPCPANMFNTIVSPPKNNHNNNKVANKATKRSGSLPRRRLPLTIQLMVSTSCVKTYGKHDHRAYPIVHDVALTSVLPMRIVAHSMDEEYFCMFFPKRANT